VNGVGRRGAAVALEHVHRVLARGLRPAQMVQGAIARDPVQPGTRVDRPLVRADRVEGGREDLLEHVLGVLLRAEHVPAECEQPRLVALHQRLEGAVVPAAGERDQPLVGLQPEERGTPGQGGQGC
jgi:hypothetical protein